MRKRFLRRTGRRISRMLAANIPPLLISSNQLLADGQFARAAAGLEDLARGSEARGGRRAARIYLEAGRARVMAGQPAAGIELLKRGLQLLAAEGASHRLARSGSRIIVELKGLGRPDEARQVGDFLRNLAPGFEMTTHDAAVEHRAPLPTHCTGCGAPVRPDEVEWLDEVTAECEYCGSPVRAE